MKDPSQRFTGLRVKVHWKACFEAFCDLHGRDWVVLRKYPDGIGGCLLFPDGWRHAMTSYQGPKWPPPEIEAERLRLIRTYWALRRRIVLREYRDLKEQIDQLEILIRMESAPIFVETVTTEVNDEGKKIRRVVPAPPDFPALNGRLQWLADDVKHCDEMIAENQDRSRNEGSHAAT